VNVTLMQAAIARRFGSALSLESIPVPSPGRGEVLVKVIACGVCHSDLHAIDGDWDPPATLPVIPGHEVTGTVAALGGGVEGVSVGDLVGVAWLYSSCGRCDYCLAGMETICPSAEATGYSRPGGYAEYLVAPADFVTRLPAGCDPVAMAPILCAGVTAYRGLKRSGVAPGQWVVVVGVGGLGHLAVQYANAMGMRVAGVDVDADKLSHAVGLGAEVAINAAEGDAVAQIVERIGGAHGVVVTATSARAFEQAAAMLRPAGTAVFLGLPGAADDDITMSIATMVNGERTVRGSAIGTRLDLQEAVDFAARGLVATTVRTVSLEDVNGVHADMRAGRIVGRVVLVL
jgi:alcohol dehydrogenase, propanol-preferring